MAGRVLKLEEADGVWTEITVPDPALACLQAAAGIVAAAPESDGRARSLERLEAGGEDAVMLAAEIVRGALAPGE